tara:strand:+ start:184 stop:612 length:429 start_codon:yes stop_codon:yes gene_type:complete
MEDIENVLLDDDGIPKIYLELDFKNISTREYYYVVSTIKHCSSLVNDDIVSISEEMVSRIKTDILHGLDKNTIILFKILYRSLHSIPNTSNLIEEMKYFCPWLIYSPSISPVVSPKVMEGMKVNHRGGKKPKVMKKVKKNKH